MDSTTLPETVEAYISGLHNRGEDLQVSFKIIDSPYRHTVVLTWTPKVKVDSREQQSNHRTGRYKSPKQLARDKERRKRYREKRQLTMQELQLRTNKEDLSDHAMELVTLDHTKVDSFNTCSEHRENSDCLVKTANKSPKQSIEPIVSKENCVHIVKESETFEIDHSQVNKSSTASVGENKRLTRSSNQKNNIQFKHFTPIEARKSFSTSEWVFMFCYRCQDSLTIHKNFMRWKEKYGMTIHYPIRFSWTCSQCNNCATCWDETVIRALSKR